MHDRNKIYDDNYAISEDIPEHFEGFYPKKQLVPLDLNGQRKVVTIDRLEKLDHFIPSMNKWRWSWCAFFEGATKYLIINKGIAEAIAKAVGNPNPTEWPGKRFMIMAGQASENNASGFTIAKAPPITEGQNNATDKRETAQPPDTPQE